MFLAKGVYMNAQRGTVGVQLLRKARAFGPARPALRSAPACKASAAPAGKRLLGKGVTLGTYVAALQACLAGCLRKVGDVCVTSLDKYSR